MSYIGRGIDQIDNISTLDNLSFNGSDATFNLTQNSVAFVPVSADALQIQIDGVIQSGNYTVSGSTVTFDFTPSGSSVCNGIRHFGVGLLSQPSDGSVNMAQLGASGTKDATTFLRGDNTFATVSADADNYFATSGLSSKDLGTGLHIKTGDSGHGAETHADELVIENNTNGGLTLAMGNSNSATIAFSNSNSNEDGKIVYRNTEREFRFNTANAERMRIASDGQVLINTTSDLGNTQGILHVKGKVSNNIARFGAGSNGEEVVFVNSSNTQVGSIAINSSSTSFNTSSDYRLKENAVAISDGITRLKTLKPYRFNFIADNDADGNPTETVDGFFAHEVTAVPEAISGEKDAVDSDNNPIHQGIDQSKLVPLLTSALQEAITKIESLEARVKTLEDA